MGSRRDWDSLFQGMAGGIATGVAIRGKYEEMKGNPPLDPQPKAPDDNSKQAGNMGAPTPMKVSPVAINALPADTSISANQRVSGMGAIGAQTQPYSRAQPAPAIPTQQATAAPTNIYKPPGLAEGGPVDIANAGLPTGQPVEGMAAVNAQPQTAIPTQAPAAQAPQEVAVGITQQTKDDWATYKQDMRQWVVNSENSIRRTQGEAGVTQFRQRFMDQNRRKSIGYATIGTQALSKGQPQVAAAMLNKMVLAMPIDTETWFTPNDSGGVTATTPEGSMDYTAEDIFALQKQAFSTTDDYVSFLNSQQGYEVDKKRTMLSRDIFNDDKGYKRAKIGLERLRLQLQKEVFEYKSTSGGYGRADDLGDMAKDAENWMMIMGQTGAEEGAFNIINYVSDTNQWQRFMDEAVALSRKNPNASNFEILNFLGGQWASEQTGLGGGS